MCGCGGDPVSAVELAAAEIERWKDRPTITRRSHMDQIVGIERLRDLLAALSSSPADDVREALVRTVRSGRRDKLNARIEWANDDTDELPFPTGQEDEYIADAILSRFEVRLRGTVTELTDATREALLAVRDEIIRNEGRADAACLATLEAIAAGVFPRRTVTEAEYEYGFTYLADRSDVVAMGNEQTARSVIEQDPEKWQLMRRKRAIAPGSWEPVDATREARS